ncbi:hypothetical protein A5482_014780 (plasmid) [Cyanobacterium sp. IPPAS B-1200]|uniref:hypothetical protein n=1 Tax=Cyanobacterium sp. IPPAS B-1200 TaxID=1562720 RepID=UPI0008527279|nr:hypothetical protein [Cyanobacterium sp. IPPAS B-1200]OEJ78136.1 hypothetical protein A5482_13945 [Cyanobacterium sp. IPPAS B-1200]
MNLEYQLELKKLQRIIPHMTRIELEKLALNNYIRYARIKSQYTRQPEEASNGLLTIDQEIPF